MVKVCYVYSKPFISGISLGTKCAVYGVLRFLLFFQLGAESADSIGAVLNSKDEQREIAETREACRFVLKEVGCISHNVSSSEGEGRSCQLLCH